MTAINIRELRKNLANYIALTEKEDIEIIKRDVVVAKLVCVHNKKSDVYTKKEVTEVKPNVYTPKTPLKSKIEIPKELIEKIPQLKKQCKVCGMGLTQYGDYCIGKGHHKQ